VKPSFLHMATTPSIMILDGSQVLAKLPGTTNRYVYDRNRVHESNSSDTTYMIVGYRGGTPSNGSGVRLTSDAQRESCLNVPFTMGVAPSFQTWSNDKAAALTYEQGNLPGLRSTMEAMGPKMAPRFFQGKGFYQIIRGRVLFRAVFRGGFWA
jgi:hypothetical protein